MDNDIRIEQKPSFVSWQQIKDCLLAAHAENLEKGIKMSHPLWAPEQIRDFVEESGVMYVAMDGEKVVGTLGIKEKSESNFWFARGRYAYMCFGSILPDYRGRGIYKALNDACEAFARQNQLPVIVLDTHSSNKHMQAISMKAGYRLVRFSCVDGGSHYSVKMAKWLNDCPFSGLYCRLMFWKSKVKTIVAAGILRRNSK